VILHDQGGSKARSGGVPAFRHLVRALAGITTTLVRLV